MRGRGPYRQDVWQETASPDTTLTKYSRGSGEVVKRCVRKSSVGKWRGLGVTRGGGTARSALVPQGVIMGGREFGQDSGGETWGDLKRRSGISGHEACQTATNRGVGSGDLFIGG